MTARRSTCVAAALLAVAAFAAPPAAALEGERAYELVSPTEKNGLDVDPRRTAPTLAGSVLFAAGGDFGNSAGGAANQYVARRTRDGWQTTPVTTRKQGSRGLWGIFAGIVDVAADDRTSVLLQAQDFDFPDDDTGAFSDAPDLFRYDLETFAVEWMTRGTQGDGAGGFPQYAGASDDFSHVVWANDQPHEPQHPPSGPGTYEEVVYESAGDDVRLVGVMGPAPGIPYTEPTRLGSGMSNYLDGSAHNAVSDDGSRIYFTRLTGTDDYGNAIGHLHLREDGSSTTDVAEDATFLTAAADGSKVFFASTAKLVPADADGTRDVYEYDVAADAYRFVAEGYGVFARLTDDGRNGLLATFQIDPGGAGGTLSLHAIRGGVVSHVADLPTGLHASDQAQATYSACFGLQVTPDARHAAFATADPLVPGDTDSAVDMYRYDADDGALARVSAGPAGGSAELPADPHNQLCDRFVALERRFITDDGRRVAFQTAEALVPEDTNGRVDVYEHDAETGELSLVSSGTGDRDSAFVALSPGGEDLFFVTRDRLVSQDGDHNVDLYSARIGGGFPPVPQPPSPCGEEQCHAPPPPAPPPVSPASETYGGPGNLMPAAPRREPATISLRRVTVAALRRAARSGRLVIVLRAGAPGRVTAVLRARGRALARGERTLPGAGTARLTLRLTRAARRALAGGRRVRLRLVVRHEAVPRAATARLTLRRTSR
ncbi:MAG TPA: hypothetical protein VHF89_11465 [Solirubrobacteraceae bacterium]|nr:hypothetical protein [Solirubrobacteraceae bacterium]